MFKSVRELEGKPRKSLMVMKKQNTDKRNQTDKVLKIWKEHFEQHLKTEFPYNESILQFIPEIMPGTGQSIEKLIMSKEEIRKVFSFFC